MEPISGYDAWKTRVPSNDLWDAFEDHLEAWTSDYLREYLEHDVYAYLNLISLLGAPGRELPSDPCQLSIEQEAILLELARSQTRFWSKFKEWAYEAFCDRRGPDHD